MWQSPGHQQGASCLGTHGHDRPHAGMGRQAAEDPGALPDVRIGGGLIGLRLARCGCRNPSATNADRHTEDSQTDSQTDRQIGIDSPPRWRGLCGALPEAIKVARMCGCAWHGGKGDGGGSGGNGGNGGSGCGGCGGCCRWRNRCVVAATALRGYCLLWCCEWVVYVALIACSCGASGLGPASITWP